MSRSRSTIIGVRAIPFAWKVPFDTAVDRAVNDFRCDIDLIWLNGVSDTKPDGLIVPNTPAVSTGGCPIVVPVALPPQPTIAAVQVIYEAICDILRQIPPRY